jgi:choline dehydrogenase-like flavoprotein
LENASPKLRAPEFSHVFRGFRDRYHILADDFSAHGSLAPGGLSNAWGAGVGTFTEHELEEYPLTRAELLPSYRAVAARIGVSGVSDDDLAGWFGTDYPLQQPHPVQPQIEPLYVRHNRRVAGLGSAAHRNFRLGRPQHAVLTENLGDRLACDLRGLCMFGCERRAIYNAADELRLLCGAPRFTYSTGWLVTRIAAAGSAFVLEATGLEDGAQRQFFGDRVIVAAGTLGSTRLALDFLGAYDVDVPLMTTPVMAFALLLRENLMAKPVEGGFSLGQLAYTLNLVGIDGAPLVFGSVFPTTGMLPTELYGRLPLLRPFARSFAAWLWPRLLVSACFFPGTYSSNTMRLRSNGEFFIRGGYANSLRAAMKQATRQLRTEFAQLGATLLPGTTKMSRPGEEMHYAGTLPMRERPGLYETDREGRIGGVDGIHIVDGTVLTALPAKSHTLTIMANADRIARLIAAKLGPSGGTVSSPPSSAVSP